MNNLDYIVVGLGNPESRYMFTRHNVGFMALDFLAEHYKFKFNFSKFSSLCANHNINGKKILFLKPQTYMNLSGNAVSSAMNFYKINPENIILIFDDVSFEVGKIRIKKKGSHGGQNGVKNIISLAKTENFPRIKIGVGNKPSEFWELADWVLSKFSGEEILKLKSVFGSVADSLECILDGNIEKAMNLYN